MKKEDVIQKAQSLKGKKAKIKKLDQDPQGDKVFKLPKEVKAGLEEHFGAKLAKVRVHAGGNLIDLNKKLKSKAFTVGENVFVKKPADAKNSDLLAHELTHVIQHSGGRMPKKSKPGTAFVSK